MKNHFILNDSEFEKAFESCSLDPSLFSHEAHVRLAWIHINKYGIDKAEKNIQKQLQKFVLHVGAKDKYHKTITIVAIKAVNHFIKQSNTDSFINFIEEFQQLKTNFKTLINSHYSIDVFNSEFAKVNFLKPDLIPFN